MSALLSAILGAALAALKDIAQAWLGARNARLERVDSNAAHERAAAAEAGAETQQTIAEIADERAALDPSPDDAGDLARRLRERAAADRAACRGDQGPAG